MKFLALEQDAAGVSDVDFTLQLRKAEAARVWELYQASVIREIYFREDRAAAVLILECEDLDEAQAALNSLPMVHEGLIAFEVIPLLPYPGFARLFAAAAGRSLGSRPSG